MSGNLCHLVGGGRRLMAKTILNFHFDYPHPSLIIIIIFIISYWVGELGLSGTGGFWHLCTWWTLREFSQRPGPQSSIGLRLERSFHLQISAKYKYREDFPSSDLFKYKYKEDYFSQERRGNHSG